jgi:hypothetical protein
MAVVAWDDVPGLDIELEKQKLNFNVLREDLLSEEEKFRSDYRMVSAELDGELRPLGEVKKARPFITYPEAVEWTNAQLSATGAEYKLYSSSVDKLGKGLLQRYIFNRDIPSPDGNGISPMVTLRAAYVGVRPAMEVHFGTFRYVCSNGAIMGMGGDSHSIKVGSQNWEAYRRVAAADQFRHYVEDLREVAEMYNKLHGMRLRDSYKSIFSAKQIPFPLRKKVLLSLEEDKVIEVHTEPEEGKKVPALMAKLLKEEDLREEVISAAFDVVEDVSMYNVYNRFTNKATFGGSQSLKFVFESVQIGRTFGTLAA